MTENDNKLFALIKEVTVLILHKYNFSINYLYLIRILIFTKKIRINKFLK